MKVTVEESYKNYKLFSIQIRQGNQFFRLDYHASKAECQWMEIGRASCRERVWTVV